MEQLTIVASSDLVDGRRVQIDEDGTGNVFAAACLGEESLVGTAIDGVLNIGIGTAIVSETMFEQVPVKRIECKPDNAYAFAFAFAFAVALSMRRGVKHLQLPSAVTELGTGLAQVKM